MPSSPPHHGVSESDAIRAIRELQSNDEFMRLYSSMPAADRALYYQNSPAPDEDKTEAILDVIYGLCVPSEMRDQLERQVLMELREGLSPDLYRDYERGTEKIIEMDRRLMKAFRDYGDDLPLSIWHCCKRGCFATLAADGDAFLVFDEVMTIHQIAKAFRDQIGEVSSLVQTRQRGIGGSTMVNVYHSRFERDPNASTDRRKAAMKLNEFVRNVLPFLCGFTDSRTGVPKPKRKLCAISISSLLGVSYNLIYKRRKALRANSKASSAEEAPAEEIIESIIDSAGVRMRQHRRVGKRIGYPEVNDLIIYDCGCNEPCFSEAPLERLHEWYNTFRRFSQELHPRLKENRFLLNTMLCPLLNRTVSICNNALSALFTVSPGKIADVRRVLDLICNDPSLNSQEVIEREAKGYRYSGRHPIKRCHADAKENIERYLDFVLRPDPGASDGVNVCRVYSPEINTQEKLRALLSEELKADEALKNPISSSTLQRMIQDYLKAKNCKISFTQSDHNACPNCKTLQYALLQYSDERKRFRRELESLEATPRPFPRDIDKRFEVLSRDVDVKKYQEDATTLELRRHTSRDGRIRRFLKQLTDAFRKTENIYRQAKIELNTSGVPINWCQRKDHAMITHQDDMTKVDLPSFIVTATSDITRWRYDINAHVNAVTGDCVVFSHEQGSGSKNASSILELILLDHLLRCRGEAVKFVVSDNAAVGKTWLTTIALPQYLVDQGLANIVVIVFLENNHGKWLADMLFGQLQLRRRRSTIPGIDALLSEFESINKKNGSVQGFAVNPLACVNFSTVLESLGYRTSSPSDFSFVKRDIHFAAACAAGAKRDLPVELRNMFGEMLPDEAGMVRICSEPPHNRPQTTVRFENRYFDIPSVDIDSDTTEFTNADDPPLVVAKDQPFAPGGPCVVSKRNMDQVGYNGFQFRKFKAYPELRNTNDPLVQETWPAGLLNLPEKDDNAEIVDDSEKLKCAPDTWIVRRPVGHFRSEEGGIVSRYPPRNMLNAKYGNAPRDEFARGSLKWKPTKTYDEPPFPMNFKNGPTNVSAFPGLEDFRKKQNETTRPLHVLDLLQCVFRRMGDRQSQSVDPWLHKPATRPSNEALEKYKNDLQLFNLRQRGYPRQTKTVKQAFKADSAVKEKVDRLRRESEATNPKTAAAIATRLFNEAANTPGALDRYEYVVKKDVERFAEELKHFKEVTQRSFDEDHGLVPIPIIQAGEPEDI